MGGLWPVGQCLNMFAGHSRPVADLLRPTGACEYTIVLLYILIIIPGNDSYLQ